MARPRARQRGPSREEQLALLVREFTEYDRCVDMVSVWEVIFTQSDTPLRERVRHFERHPRIVHPDGRLATPEFTVVFNDGAGLACEFASLGLDEASVDGLCTQVGRYDSLAELPVGPTASAPVDHVDVMVVVPLEIGTASVRRVIEERALNEDHTYAPSNTPIIVQQTFATDPERYVFQRRPEEHNGRFRVSGAVPANADLGAGWFYVNDVKMQPHRFRELKAAKPFTNDPVPDLYLCTFLWTKVFPLMATPILSGAAVALHIEPAELARLVREKFGPIRTRDVRRAMTLLTRARLAARTRDGWVVYWQDLRSTRDRDIAAVIARRVVTPPRETASEQARRTELQQADDRQERLFP